MTALETQHLPRGIAKTLGFRLVSGGEGRLTIEMDTTEDMYNAIGTVHGGVFCDLSDAAMGLAFATLLDDEESFTTVELKINYLRPVWKTRLRAEARTIKKGKTLGIIDCDVLDGDGKLVARASSTCMILRGEQAKGR